MSNQKTQQTVRSLFWPIMLIGAGAIWLLYNLNMIPPENLWVLLRLWPILIILGGINVLFSRRFAVIGAILGLLVMAGAAYILMFSDELDFVSSPEPTVETFNVEKGNTTAADLKLSLSFQDTSVHSLSNSGILFLAEIGHMGDIDFDVSGEAEKSISLRQTGWESGYQWLESKIGGEELFWDIGLSPSLPFDLTVGSSVGKVELDLSEITLNDFEFDGSTGASTIILPASGAGYESRIEASTGNITVVLPENSNLTVYVDGSAGQIVLDAPDDAAVKVIVESGGTGDLHYPTWLIRTSGETDRDEGTYQTNGFEDSPYQITIIVEDISTGNIVIK